MASIARKNLLEDIPRFLVAQAGILFAVSLVTIQTGLQYGFARSSSQLIDQSRADIWVSSKNMQHLGLTLPIPYERVTKASKVKGVAKAEAVIIDGGLWHELATDKINSITLVGADPQGMLFDRSNIVEGRFNDFKQSFRFMIDKTNLNSIDLKRLGEVGEINNIPAKLVGFTQGTQSIVFGTLMFTSLETANTYRNYGTQTTASPNNVGSSAKKPVSKDQISFVLVKAKRGQSIAKLKRDLEQALPDTRAYTRQEMSKITQDFWQVRSGIGFILGLGAVVGVVVGAVVVSQILYASVTDHIKEFGTLKAMGASDWFIYNVIIEQAIWMAILGYLPGIALCVGVAAWTSTTQGIVILITPVSALVVFGITVLMCVGSAVFAIQKVTRVDPAIVFKG
ncbi:ABC transporter permease [Brasilonema octagenarum UFV-E1]|uniref:ABC transporter permease n=1 Tax=Brasilonema sennae CENA114 TaxID=415709 RepID=A0A856MFK6_9CYAN|nr:FtsX-like permease family protein [Brasilonema sennae]QDL09074.1 ABC transporter permease [Brasilonema sennae CENA114]QDL15432.1 ABC transporter permease [Brasilonema octagenarum UFV-E1]